MMRLVLRGLIGCGLAVMAAMPGCRRDPLAEGTKDLERGQFKRAEPLLELAASREPNSASAQANLGIAHMKLGHTDQAMAAFRKGADLAPDDPRPLEFAASIRADQGRWKEASDLLVAALRRDPRSPRVMTALAVAELHLHGPQAARVRLTDTLVLAPNYSPALFNLARVQKEWLADPEAAEALLQRYLKVAPNGEHAAEAKAALRIAEPSQSAAGRKQKPKQGGAAPAKQAVLPTGVPGALPQAATPSRKPAPRNAPAAAEAYNKGVRSHTAGNLDEAAEAYIRAIENDPGMTDAYYNLGLVYQTKGELAKAQDALQQAVNLSPDMINGRFMLALVLQSRNDDAAAISEFTRLLQKAPKHAEAHLALGLLYRKGDKPDLAKKEFVSYLELKPDGASAQNTRNWLKTSSSTASRASP